MPRMPYPHCDHACQNKNVSNASDNIKLKILEDKLRNDLVQKDLTDLPEVSEVKSSDYLYVYDSEQEQVKKISTSEILNQVDLDDYAKKEDLNGYAEKEHTHEQYLTEHQSLEEYAKKSELFSGSYNDLIDKPELFNGDYNSLTNKPEIPSIEGLASEEFVNNAIANIEHPANPTKVSELENDANYTNETKVLELIENNASSKIGISFTTDITVGHLVTGTVIPETMTISELLKKILVCEHEWEAADCDSPRTCRLCGKTEGEALGHNWGGWVITKPAEIGVAGEQQRTCSRCNEVETQIIPALPQPEKPSVPGIPEDSAAGNIIANSVPAYSGTASTGDKEVAFKILDTATAAPTDQGLYVTYNENNEAIATGYQLTMKGNTDMDAQTFALPVGATIIRAWQYDEMGKTWLEYNFPGDYWRPSDIVTKTIGDVTYEYQSYIYNVEDIGDAITNDEYWRFEMGVNS